MSLYQLHCFTCKKTIGEASTDFVKVNYAQIDHHKAHPGHDAEIGVYYPDIKAWDYRQGSAILSAYLDSKQTVAAGAAR